MIPRRREGRWMVGAVVSSLLMLTLPAVAGDGVVRLSLDDCIRTAMEKNQQAERSEARIEEAEAARRKVRGHFGPVLMVEAGVQYWNEPTEIEFALPSEYGVPPIAMEVQSQTTSQLSITVAQPVTGLWAVYEGYRAATLEKQVREREHDDTNQKITKSVADAYYQALTAERMARIAELSEKQVEEHVKRARALYRNDLIAKNALLEAEVRLAEVKAAVIQARSGVELSRSNLAFTIGLPANKPVAPAPVAVEDDIPLAPYQDDVDVALKQRKDLSVVKMRQEQAEAGYRAAWAQMLPEINLLASAQYASGSSFQKEEAYFIGAQLKWTVWEWGATYYGVEEARAKMRQANTGEVELREAIQLQVTKARIDLDSAQRRVAVVKASVAQAEENLRITQRRFEQDSNTSSDVLDAETLLARARANLATAQYEVERARIALRHAMGIDPVAR